MYVYFSTSYSPVKSTTFELGPCHASKLQWQEAFNSSNQSKRRGAGEEELKQEERKGSAGENTRKITKPSTSTFQQKLFY